MDPTVTSAIISAIVSLLIAGISGLYVLSRTRRELDQIKNRIITEDHSKRFLNEATQYRKEYDIYVNKKRKLDHLLAIGNETDGIILVQHILDFFGTSREFYQRNPSVLKNSVLDKKIDEVSQMIDSGILNKPNENRLTINRKCCSICIDIFENLYENSVG